MTTVRNRKGQQQPFFFFRKWSESFSFLDGLENGLLKSIHPSGYSPLPISPMVLLSTPNQILLLHILPFFPWSSPSLPAAVASGEKKRGEGRATITPQRERDSGGGEEKWKVSATNGGRGCGEGFDVGFRSPLSCDGKEEREGRQSFDQSFISKEKWEKLSFFR